MWVTPDTIREKHESEEEWKQLYEAVRADPDHTAISQGAEQKQSPRGTRGIPRGHPFPWRAEDQPEAGAGGAGRAWELEPCVPWRARLA